MHWTSKIRNVLKPSIFYSCRLASCIVSLYTPYYVPATKEPYLEMTDLI